MLKANKALNVSAVQASVVNVKWCLLKITLQAPFLNVKRRLNTTVQASVFMEMSSVHISSGLVLYQMTSDHNRSELGIQDHSNEQSSSKLVPKVVPLAVKTATSRQELELLFHHHIAMLRTTGSQAVIQESYAILVIFARTFGVILFSIHNDEWKSFQCHHQTALRVDLQVPEVIAPVVEVIAPVPAYVTESQQAVVQNSNSSAQQDALILSVIEQLKTQVINYTKINLDNKSVNDTLTAELERYKEQVKVLKEGQNVDLKSKDNVSDSCEQSVEIDRLKQTLSEHLKEKESLMQTVTLLKNDFKKEESRNKMKNCFRKEIETAG
ncbi:hypothetical protein Tco_1285903 [Tanacetum coccineum]